MFLRIILVSLLLLPATVRPVLAGDKYQWPLRIPPELTSKFCDYRAGHFHGGLDIRTEGRTGFRVYAIDDGYVYRVTTSFRGFGKALYLRLKDGRLAVYGHLSGFTHAIDDRILRGQIKDKKYDQDLYFTAGEFPVKKGQQVALSGSSGTGAPHLHLELRSPFNDPLNPLKFGFTIPDRIPPEFHELAIRYYRYGFQTADPGVIEFLPVTKLRATGQYTIEDTIVTNDDIALAVSGGDRIQGAGFLYGFSGLRVYFSDSLNFEMNSDSLSFNTTRQLNYVRDLELTSLFGKRGRADGDENIFYRLYVPPRANQFFWPGFSDGDGVIPSVGLPGSVRNVIVIAQDEAGNQARLRFYLKKPKLDQEAGDNVSYEQRNDSLIVRFAPPAGADVQLQSRDSPSSPFTRVSVSQILMIQGGDISGRIYVIKLSSMVFGKEYRFRYYNTRGDVSSWRYFRSKEPAGFFGLSGSPEHLRLELSLPLAANPLTLSIDSGGKHFITGLSPNGPGNYVADMIQMGLVGPTKFLIGAGSMLVDTGVVLNAVVPDKETEAFSPDSTLVVTFSSGSAFYPAYVFPSNSIEIRAFDGKAQEYDIAPSFLVAKAPIKFTFDAGRLDLVGKKVGVYGYSEESGKWIFISKIEGTKLEAPGFGLGRIALIEDNEPPIISSVAPTGGTRFRMPLMSCVISDRISGLALDDGISMTLDDTWVPAEFDIDSGRFSYEVGISLKPGKHRLEIMANDNQGNSASETVEFLVLGKY